MFQTLPGQCSSWQYSFVNGNRVDSALTDREPSLCISCKIVENETHFLISCPIYHEERQTLITQVSSLCLYWYPQSLDMDEQHAFLFLITNEDPNILTWTGKFIYSAFVKRRSLNIDSGWHRAFDELSFGEFAQESSAFFGAKKCENCLIIFEVIPHRRWRWAAFLQRCNNVAQRLSNVLQRWYNVAISCATQHNVVQRDQAMLYFPQRCTALSKR